MINLQKIGFEVLTKKTQNDFQKLFEEYSKKISHKLKNVNSLKIFLKEYSPGGKIKYSIQITASYSGKILEASVSDWDLNKAFHKVFNKIEQEAEHLFHISDQNKGNKRKR